MSSDTRDRMIDATVDALSRHGVSGMSFTEVLEHSGAARGAIYHHFPRGKGQLVAEATGRAADQVRERLAALDGPTPTSVVEAFLALVRPVVAASAEGGGCAVAAASVGSADDDGLRDAACSAFAGWIDVIAARLAAAGQDPRSAADTAALLISLLEGAHVLCRAAGDLAPFDAAARAAVSLVRAG
jgi:AcrR family transcriptional regulator